MLLVTVDNVHDLADEGHSFVVDVDQVALLLKLALHSRAWAPSFAIGPFQGR